MLYNVDFVNGILLYGFLHTVGSENNEYEYVNDSVNKRDKSFNAK